MWLVLIEPPKIKCSFPIVLSQNCGKTTFSLDDPILYIDFDTDVLFLNFGFNAFSTIDPTMYTSSSINEHVGTIFEQTTMRKIGWYMFKLNPYSIGKQKSIVFNRTLLIGHRGCGSNVLGNRVRENTMLSFNRAAQAKLDGVELDVLLTKDGQLVIYHDLEYPIKVGNSVKNIPIADLEYSDMLRQRVQRQVSADGSSLDHSGYVWDDIPLLETVLRSLDPEVGIVVELKYPTNETIRKNPSFGRYTRTELVEAVLTEIEKSVTRKWIVMSSFDPDICMQLSKTPFLVVHNVWFGHEGITDNTVDFSDIRNSDCDAAVMQARMIQGGIAFEAEYALKHCLDTKKFNNVPLLSYGKDNLHIDNVRMQIASNFWGIFVDGLKIIKYSTWLKFCLNTVRKKNTFSIFNHVSARFLMRFVAPWSGLALLMITPSRQSQVEASSLIAAWNTVFSYWYEGPVVTTSSPVPKKNKKKNKKKAVKAAVVNDAEEDSDESDDDVVITTLAPTIAPIIGALEIVTEEEAEGFTPVSRGKSSKDKAVATPQTGKKSSNSGKSVLTSPNSIKAVDKMSPAVVRSEKLPIKQSAKSNSVPAVVQSNLEKSEKASVIPVSEALKTDALPTAEETLVTDAFKGDASAAVSAELNFHFGTFHEEAIAKESVKHSVDEIAVQENVITVQDRAITVQDDAITVQYDAITVQDDAIIDQDDTIALQDDIAENDSTLNVANTLAPAMTPEWTATEQALVYSSANQVYLWDAGKFNYKIVAPHMAAYVSTMPVFLQIVGELTPLLSFTDSPRSVYRASADGINPMFELKVSSTSALNHEANVLQAIERLGIAPKFIYLAGFSQASGPSVGNAVSTVAVVPAVSSLSTVAVSPVALPPIHSVTEAVGMTLAEYAGTGILLSDLIGRFAQVIKSLRALHLAGIVHGNISEFTLRLDVEFGRVLLTDFEYSMFYPRFTCPQYKMVDQQNWSPSELAGEDYLPRDDLYRAIESLFRILYGQAQFTGLVRGSNIMTVKTSRNLFDSISVHRIVAKQVKQKLNQALTNARKTSGKLHYNGIIDSLNSAHRILRSQNL